MQLVTYFSIAIAQQEHVEGSKILGQSVCQGCVLFNGPFNPDTPCGMASHGLYLYLHGSHEFGSMLVLAMAHNTASVCECSVCVFVANVHYDSLM